MFYQLRRSHIPVKYLGSCQSAVDGLYSVREVKSALSQHSATNRCKCTSWMTLLLSDVDLDQIDHTYGCRAHPWTSPLMQQLKLARS